MTFDRKNALMALPAIEARNGPDTAKVLRSMLEGTAQPADMAAAIVDVDDAATGAELETAINGILAVLRAHKMIAA